MPKDLEAGKDFADEVLRQIIEEYRGRIAIERYEWKYEGDRFSYSLYLYSLNKPYRIPFISTDLQESAHTHNITERVKIQSIMRQTFEALLAHRNLEEEKKPSL